MSKLSEEMPGMSHFSIDMDSFSDHSCQQCHRTIYMHEPFCYYREDLNDPQGDKICIDCKEELMTEGIG